MEIKSNARKNQNQNLFDWNSLTLLTCQKVIISETGSPASSQKAKNKIKTGRLISGRTCLSPAKSRWGPPASGVQWKTEQNRQKIRQYTIHV